MFFICLSGAESTGKTSLSKAISSKYNVPWVGEFAREFLSDKNGVCEETDIEKIVSGQISLEAKIYSENDYGFAVCDTDILTTYAWSYFLFRTPLDIDIVSQLYGNRFYFVLDNDIPWENDGHRYYENRREEFLKIVIFVLEKYNQDYILIKGRWQEKLHSILNLIDNTIIGQ